MAKPHKLAWNGIDIDTVLSIDQLGNMAQRAAHESTGDMMRGKHKIVSTGSTDRAIQFRMNDFLISFNKHMLFNVELTPSGERTFLSTTIDWYMTTQSTVAGFIPVSTKSMVGHHTYMQFCRNLAEQVRAADPSAKITLREGVQTTVPTPVKAAPPAVTGAPIPVSEPAGTQTKTPPPPPPPAPSAVGVPAALPPLPPLPPMPTPTRAGSMPPPPPPPPPPVAVPGNLVTGIPGAVSTAPPTPVPPPPIPNIDPLAVQMIQEDEDLDATRLNQTANAQPWKLTFSDGQVVMIGQGILIGRHPHERDNLLQISVDDPWRSLSKTHAQIEARDGLLWVTDLHSTNGTTVTNAIGEATQCPAGVAMPVGESWQISVGEVNIRIELGE